MNIVFRKIKIIVDNYLVMIEACKRIKSFLPPGIYTIRNRRIIKGRGVPYFKVKSQPANDAISEKEIRFYYGGWSSKIVAFVGERVFSFYKESDKKRIANIERYYDSLKYPKSNFFKFSTDELYTITDFTEGKSLYDLGHLSFLAHELLNYAKAAKKEEKPKQYEFINESLFKNIQYYVQHGDFAAKNVLWQDDYNYVVIDLDTIDVFPVFYDFFRLVIINLKDEGIERYIKGDFDKDISEFISSQSLDVSVEAFKDESLAVFTLTTYKYWFTDNIINNKVPSFYEKTRLILSDCANWRASNRKV